LVEAKNNAESMCFQLEKLLKEHDAVLNQTDKDAIHSAIGQTREAIASEDLARIKSATDQLEQASHAMSKAMYESAAAQQAAGNESREHSAAERPDQPQGDDDAIDAEFEVKK